MGAFGSTIVLANAAAVVTLVILELARWARHLVAARPFLLTTAAALAVGGLAIAFNQATDQPLRWSLRTSPSSRSLRYVLVAAVAPTETPAAEASLSA